MSLSNVLCSLEKTLRIRFMERKRILSVVVILLLVSTASIALVYLFQGNGDESTEEFIIEPHPFNSLNWWDIAWEIADVASFNFPIIDISGFGGRYDGTDMFSEAADYVVDELEKYSIEASLWGDHGTPVGYQEGYGSDNRAIVFGAHLDSYPGRLGVDNNAAGCAVILMIASALSQFRFPVDIYYCFFAGNLAILDPMAPIRMFYGSREVTEIFAENDVDIIAFFNFDELLFRDPVQPESRRLLIEHKPVTPANYHSTRYLADLLRAHMLQTGLNIISPIDGAEEEGDQDAFWAHGYPCITITSGHHENPRNPPMDSVNSEDYNTTQAILLARAAASVGTYLALKGNGKETCYKIERTIPVNETLKINTVMTTPQPLTVSGQITTDSNVILTLGNGSLNYIAPIQLESGEFSITTNTDVHIGPIRLSIENNATSDVSVDMWLNYTSDTNGDDVLDSDQYTWPDPEPPLDWDKDGLSDIDEQEVGTDIFVPDTDQDTILDGVEFDNGLNPLKQDTQDDYDADSLTNLQEVNIGTDPLNNDTDGDTMLDGWEHYFGTDPLINDAELDPDNDTLTNLDEFNYGSDPFSIDGDNDGITDVEEIELGMNPLDIDTDNDGLRDYLELLNGLDPLTPDYDVDLAPDGPDHNPRINTIIILGSIILVPVMVGSVVFWKRQH
jgi:hypothetical protein